MKRRRGKEARRQKTQKMGGPVVPAAAAPLCFGHEMEYRVPLSGLNICTEVFV